MTSSPGPELVIIGDDLSGSAESAAVFGRYGYDVRIGLRSMPDTGAIRVVDADTRQLTPRQARDRAAEVINDAGAGRIVLKLDSLLRGHLVPHLAALQPERHPVVFAPALPVQDRIVTGGIAYDRGRVIGGRPLQELIAPLPAESIPASLDVAALTDRLTAVTGRGRIAICDAVDDADLDRLVEAASCLPDVRFVGATGLSAALARRLPPGPRTTPRLRGPNGSEPGSARTDHSGPALCVLGTAAAPARRQVEALITADRELRVWTRPIDGWESDPTTEIRDHLATGRSAVIRLDVPVISTTTDLLASDDLGPVAALADLTAKVASDPKVPLVLSGGQTARAVLDRLGVIMLEVTAEIHYGAVALRTDDGRTVVTRPGSFGASDSLIRILAHLTPAAPVPGRPVPS